ncbi:pilus assembly protein PilM [bacterium LRH843]|nr:pilus assembly protein PilM [bacterium LRH843]
MQKRTRKKGARHALVIKDNVIRYVGSKRPDLVEIYVHGERYLPPGVVQDGQIVSVDTFSTIVAECMDEWDLRRKEIQFCVPDSQVIIRNHKVDSSIPDEEIKGQLYLDLGETLLLPFDDPVFDYIVLGIVNGQKDVLLFVSKEKTIQDYVEVFEELRLKPNAADLSALSAYRLFHELGKTKSDGYTMLIQVDVLLANITILYEHHPVFSRTIQTELEQTNWQAEQKSGSTLLTWQGDENDLQNQIEELVSEVEKVMNFYRFNVLKGEGEINQLLVCGDHPYLENITQRFKQTFSNDLICFDEKELPLPERFYDVLGLSLKKEVR